MWPISLQFKVKSPRRSSVSFTLKSHQAEKRAIERPPTADLNAFDLYIRAKNLHLTVDFSAKTKENLLQAVDLLNQAVAHDPSFFQAFCQLSLAHGLLHFYGYDHSSARLALVEAALATASRLRPDAGETHLARAWNLYVDTAIIMALWLNLKSP